VVLGAAVGAGVLLDGAVAGGAAVVAVRLVDALDPGVAASTPCVCKPKHVATSAILVRFRKSLCIARSPSLCDEGFDEMSYALRVDVMRA
jgi:NaMN:DMB phosphoribosyltransferase